MKKDNLSQNWGIIGHQGVVNFLATNIAQHRVHHAYALVGPDGVGKHAIVMKAVQALLCPTQEAGQPCGECLACQQVTSGTHPDVLTLRRWRDEKTDKLKSTLSVEQIRALKERLSLGSLTGQWTIGIILEADTMMAAGANALLKLLEEPHRGVVLFLVAESLNDLPTTIPSRCHVLQCATVSRQIIYDALIARGLNRDQSITLAALAAGRPGLMMSYVTDPPALAARQMALAQTATGLDQSGSAQFRAIQRQIQANDDPAQVAAELLQDWTDIGRDLVLLRSSTDDLPAGLRYVWLKDQLKTSKLYLSPTVGLCQFLERCQTAPTLLAANLSPQLVLEHTLLALMS